LVASNFKDCQRALLSMLLLPMSSCCTFLDLLLV
jgi:hypothetical protein